MSKVQAQVRYTGLNNQAFVKEAKIKGFWAKSGVYTVEVTQTVDKIKVCVARAKKPKSEYILNFQNKKLKEKLVNLSSLNAHGYKEVLENINWKEMGLSVPKKLERAFKKF